MGTSTLMFEILFLCTFLQEGHIARECENQAAEGAAKEAILNEKNSYRRCFNCGK